MEFKVGHLLYTKNIMLRVIATGESHIEVLEYDIAHHTEDMLVPKIYSKIDGDWFKWTALGGKKVDIKKIGVIKPTKVPFVVRDFLSLGHFETLIINNVPFKKVSKTSLNIPLEWDNPHYLKSQSGEAVLYVQITKRESLSDRGFIVYFLSENKTKELTSNDIVWVINEN